MTKEFLTKDEVFIVKGYLSKDAKKVVPIFNQAFVEAQRHAEYIITFAKIAKGKDFIGKEADSVDDLVLETMKSLSVNKVEYIQKPKAVEQKLQNQLKNEALAFIRNSEETSKVERINIFLQRFNILNEFSEIGLFFEQDIVKLSKIYTIEEVVKAVESVIDLLD